MKRVGRNQPIDFSGWAGRVLREHSDRNWYEVWWVRLPVFGMAPMDYGRHEAWAQRVLIFDNKDGFSLRWLPVPQKTA